MLKVRNYRCASAGVVARRGFQTRLASMLSFNHKAWLWTTGLEHQPGPGGRGVQRLFRRLCAKTTVAACPPPAPSPMQRERDVLVHASPDPLPSAVPCTGFTIIETKNITSFSSYAEGLAQRCADVTFFQEHCASSAAMARFAYEFKSKHERQLHYTGPDPNHSQPCAGVGAIGLAADTCLPLDARCPKFAKFIELGRAQLLAHGKGKAAKVCHWYNIYGYTGSHGNSTKAAATDSIIQAIVSDHSLRGLGPTFIVGDINADPADLPTLSDLLTTQGWTDLGAAAATWGQPASQPTCITKQSNAATRRDYMFCNASALSLVRGLFVRAGDLCPTHSTVEVHLALDAPAFSMNKQRFISPLDGLVQQAFLHLYGDPPVRPSSDDLLSNSWSRAHPDDDSPTTNLQHAFFSDYRFLKQTYEDKHSDFIYMQRQHIDAHLRSITPNLQSAIQTGNLDWFWEKYWATIELAVFEFTNFSHKGTEEDALGRGRPTVRKVTHQPLFAAGLEGNHEAQQPSWLLHLAKQGNRTKHLATCYHVLAKGKATGDKLERLKHDIGAATTNCLRYFHAASSSPGVFEQPGQRGGPPSVRYLNRMGNCSSSSICPCDSRSERMPPQGFMMSLTFLPCPHPHPSALLLPSTSLLSVSSKSTTSSSPITIPPSSSSARSRGD